LSKVKFFYNSKTLSYERYREGWKRKALRVGYFLLSTLVFAVAILYVGFEYLDSPKERRMERQLSHLHLSVEQMVARMNQLESVLEDLEGRDNSIYRAIFEAEPISKDVRLSGIGGYNRYRHLEGFPHSQWLQKEVQRLDVLSKRMYIQSKSYDEVWEMIRNKHALLASIPAIIPVDLNDLNRMTSGFGYRIDPIYKTKKFHAGMDFVADVGTPVYATGNGIVQRADREASGYGNHVRINHGYGYLTLYAHLSEISVRPGQKIKRGEIIGRVGNTGKSVGPHLHYEVHKNGIPVNPVNFYYADISPEAYAEILEASRQEGQALD